MELSRGSDELHVLRLFGVYVCCELGLSLHCQFVMFWLCRRSARVFCQVLLSFAPAPCFIADCLLDSHGRFRSKITYPAILHWFMVLRTIVCVFRYWILVSCGAFRVGYLFVTWLLFGSVWRDKIASEAEVLHRESTSLRTTVYIPLIVFSLGPLCI